MIRNLSLQNFKGANSSHTFTEANVLLGRNFSGKSAIDEAIRCLVLGYVPGKLKTAAAMKAFASDYPMRISMDGGLGGVGHMGGPLAIAFDKVKSTIKQTEDKTLANVPDLPLDEPTRVLFDSSIFFGLSDSARISKACELVQSEGGSPADLQDSVEGILGPGNPVLSAWSKSVLVANKTINDILAESEVYFKNERKLANEEKARQQKTAEGVTDATAIDSEAANLPTRTEVEAQKTSLFAEINDLSGKIAKGQTLRAAHLARTSRIDDLTAKAGWLSQHQVTAAAASKTLVDLEAEIQKLDGEMQAANTALSSAQAKMKAYNDRADLLKQLESGAGQLPGLTQAVATAEKNLSDAKTALATAKAKVDLAGAATANARVLIKTFKPKPEDAVRTDDFESNAVRGREYSVTCRLSYVPRQVGLKPEPTVVEVHSWREVRTEDQMEREQNEQLEADLSVQAASEAQEAWIAAARAQTTAQEEVERKEWLLGVANSALDTCKGAVAQYDRLKGDSLAQPHTGVEMANLAAAVSSVSVKINAARLKLPGAKAEEKMAAEGLSQCRYNAAELARVQAEPAPDVTGLGQSDEDWQIAIEETRRKYAAANETLEKIIGFEQDKKRIAEAAAKREAVDATIKTYGKVLDLLAQKKREIVSGSIEAPLAIANKLALGILRGELVFQEGEIGMLRNGKFVSSRVFSGTESAITMMGLTAGLAARSSLRVLMLDEVSIVGPENIGRLMENLLGLVVDGHIDQFFLFGTQYTEIVAAVLEHPQINFVRV